MTIKLYNTKLQDSMVEVTWTLSYPQTHALVSRGLIYQLRFTLKYIAFQKACSMYGGQEWWSGYIK